MRIAAFRRLGWVFVVCAACFSAAALAQSTQYEYDQLGRLVRAIDSQGRVTEYVYDPAGNLLQVIRGGTATAPSIATLSPTSIRRNQVLQVQITGTALNGVSVDSDDPAIAFSGFSGSATAVSFRMLVFKEARLGTHTLTLRNAAGVANVSFDVLAAVEYQFTPVPVAIPPDSSTRVYTIDASVADTQPLTLSVSSLNTAIARPGATTVSLPAGSTQTTGTVIGVAVGNTTLRFTSPILVEPIDLLVGVTNDFSAATVTRSQPLGLVKGNPTLPSANTPSTAVGGPLGIVKGDPTAPSANSPSTVGTPPVGVTRN